MIDNKFDPIQDLRKDSQGLSVLVNKPHLEEEVRKYIKVAAKTALKNNNPCLSG